jgi:hypothetical protein
MLQAFLPTTAEKISAQLGYTEDDLKFENLKFGYKTDVTVKKGDVIFPRIDIAKEMKLLEEQEKAKKEAAEKERNAMFTRFLEIYPDVKATDIPQSVWAEVKQTGNLVEAYARHENKQLRDKVAVLEQNAKNAARSTGSRKSAGASKPKDPFDDIWDSF